MTAAERASAASSMEQTNGASERANGRVSDPVLTSGFLIILDHSASIPCGVNPRGVKFHAITPSTYLAQWHETKNIQERGENRTLNFLSSEFCGSMLCGVNLRHL